MMLSEDVSMCVDYGADIIGIVVEHSEPVPWNVDMHRARQLIAACGNSVKSCVVSHGDAAKLIHLARTLKPDYLQVHFGESVEDIARLLDELQNCCETKLIVAVSPNILLEEAAELSKTGVAALLLDKRILGNAAVGGQAEPRRFKSVQNIVSCPVILAGGLNPTNIEQMLRLSQARMIDVMTGVEAALGMKDEAKVSALFRNLLML
jgi:phosphoribosylanthranilate isomerase